MLQNSYDHIAEQWHRNFRGQVYAERVLGYLDKILDGLPPQAEVLDLGCGTGNLIAGHILERGFSLTGVDQSAEMLNIARSVNPGGHFIHADMLEIQLTEKYAAAVAWDSVFHVERKYHPEVFHKLSNSLVTGGRLLISVGGSDAEDPAADEGGGGTEPEGFTSEMFGQTFFYSGYAPNKTRGLLEAAGFEIEVWEIDDPASRGHIAVIARKTA